MFKGSECSFWEVSSLRWLGLVAKYHSQSISILFLFITWELKRIIGIGFKVLLTKYFSGPQWPPLIVFIQCMSIHCMSIHCMSIHCMSIHCMSITHKVFLWTPVAAQPPCCSYLIQPHAFLHSPSPCMKMKIEIQKYKVQVQIQILASI